MQLYVSNVHLEEGIINMLEWKDRQISEGQDLVVMDFRFSKCITRYGFQDFCNMTFWGYLFCTVVVGLSFRRTSPRESNKNYWLGLSLYNAS